MTETPTPEQLAQLPPPDAPTPPPPPGPPPAPHAARPGRAWSERLPELAGGLGAALVAAAVVGFISGTWAELGAMARGSVLALVSAGLAAAAVWTEDRLRRGPDVASLLWAAGAAATAGAVLLLLGDAVPHRVALALAGGAAAAEAAVSVRRRVEDPLRQVTVALALVLAAGPPGTSLDDRFADVLANDVLAPVAGLLDPTFTTDRLLVPGVGHLLVGAAWLWWSSRTSGRPARAGAVGGGALVAAGALQVLVAPDAVGALVALLAAAGLLVHGLSADRPGRVVTGAVLLLATGGRVLWALFSGEVAVTVGALVAGLGLLAWAVRARRRDEQEAPSHT